MTNPIAVLRELAPTRRRWAVGIVVVVVAAVGGGLLAIRSGDGDLPDGAVLAAEGTVVDRATFDRRVEVLGALYGVTPPEEPEDLRRFRGEAAKAIALSILIEQDASERGVHVAQRTVRDALTRYITQAYPEGGREAFVTALGDRGVSEQDVLDEIRRQLVVRQLFDELTGDLEVGEDDVRDYVAEHADELAVPEQRRLRHVVTDSEEAARDVLRRLEAGNAFPEVASAVSLDGSTRSSGGDLGFVDRSQLLEPFAGAAFEAEAGAVFGPVQTELGWHVGLVEEIVPRREVALDDVADEVRERIQLEQALERWRQHLRSLIEDGNVRYAADFRPEHPDRPPSAEVPGLNVPPIPTTSTPSTSAEPGAGG